MKDHYVGDINDFKKYDLLDNIRKVLGKRILVVWMKTTSDGSKTDYLKNELYKAHNESLYNDLSKILRDNTRTIRHAKEIGVLKGCQFFSKPLTNHQKERKVYFEEVSKLADGADLVFFDPDNGIAPNQKGKKYREYIYWDEIQEIWRQKKDILLYQHFPHEKREVFIEKIKMQCNAKLDKVNVKVFVSDTVTFVLLLHQKDDRQLETIEERWKRLTDLGTVKADDGSIFSYEIDRNPDISGYGLGICPIEKEIAGLKLIRADDIAEAGFTKKETDEMFCCNTDEKGLVGNYYDKDGWVYTVVEGNHVYRLLLKLKLFKNLYRKKTDKG